MIIVTIMALHQPILAWQADTIYVVPEANRVKATDMISSYQLVPLQTGGEVIGTIHRLIVTESGIYLSDRPYNRVYSFDHDGRLRYSIQRPKRATQKSGTITDIAINDFKGTLEVLDAMEQQIISYELETGSLIDSVAIDFYGMNFVPLQIGYAFYQPLVSHDKSGQPDPRDKTILILDDNWKVVNGALDIHETGLVRTNFSIGWSLTRNGMGSPLLLPTFHQTIYEVNTDGVSPAHHLSFGVHDLPPDFLHPLESPHEIMKIMMAGGYVWNLSRFYESNTHMTFSYFIGKDAYKGVFDKSTRNCLSYRSYDNDANLFYLLPRAVYQDYHISVSSFQTLQSRKDWLESNIDPVKLWQMPEYHGLSNALNTFPKANPVLVFSKFRPIE